MLTTKSVLISFSACSGSSRALYLFNFSTLLRINGVIFYIKITNDWKVQTFPSTSQSMPFSVSLYGNESDRSSSPGKLKQHNSIRKFQKKILKDFADKNTSEAYDYRLQIVNKIVNL
jgi:hypothetical protein